MKIHVHLLLYLHEFFLEWEMFQICCSENQNKYFMFNNLFSRISCRLWDNVENMVETDRPQMTTYYVASTLRVG
jgi:hypothetical protein